MADKIDKRTGRSGDVGSGETDSLDRRMVEDDSLRVGLKGSLTDKVTEDKTARAVGSGDLAVYATPAMIALMEEASYKLVAPYLEEGQGTVGTRMEVRHLSASPVGMQVTCESEIRSLDGRRIEFSVRCQDEKGLIGEGVHERFIIDKKKFIDKAQAKGKG